jgi:putative heme iron utilization protein
MSVVRVRWIGGFGEIGWLEPRDVLRDPGSEGIAAAADEIIEHMNADHADVLVTVCEARCGFRPAAARMTAIDRAGFLMRTSGPERLVHVSFGREIHADDARDVFVGLAREARQRLKQGRDLAG